ncbi:MAG: sugar transferase [Paludibacter sp.]|nr:sugar transferase [Paludibacter sp.]
MNSKSNKLIYSPSVTAIVVDVLILILSAFAVFAFGPFTTQTPFQKYFDITLLYSFLWLIISYLYKRYAKDHKKTYAQDAYQLLWTIISVLILYVIFIISPLNTNYSIWIIIGFSLLNFLFGSIYFIIEFTIKNAIEYNDVVNLNQKVRTKTPIAAEKLDLMSTRALTDSIKEYCGEKVYRFISRHIDFHLKSNLITFSSNYFDIKSKPDNKYSCIAIFNSLNNIRGINKLFSIANQKLPLDGTFICCFEQRSTRKMNIYRKYPVILNSIIYFFDYLTKRVIPKLMLLDKIYFNLTQGKNRVLSRTEVLGRLIYCGYDIVEIKKINGLAYVIARKIIQLDEILESKRYGPLLKLRRLGKNGKVIEVLKFRTMYPYAEYLQAYIYRNYSLQKGGKFNRDMRVSTLGKFMRRYWIDEFPMFINILRGEMKLVGVRPLSRQYYELYEPLLQQKRIRFKPGLLPPFYADLPETLEEIQESELRYLRACENNGEFITDIKYLMKILKNILIKRVKSA